MTDAAASELQLREYEVQDEPKTGEDENVKEEAEPKRKRKTEKKKKF